MIDNELSELLRSIVREELEKFAESRLGKVVQTEMEFSLRRDAANIERYIQRQALRETVDFINEQMPDVRSFPTRYTLLDFVLSQITVKGEFLEFGVYKGSTINHVADAVGSEITLYGFDSFEGLPEDWRQGFEKGAYNVEALPEVRSNVKLIKGWFNETLPPFVKEHPGNLAFLHVDCDLYSSTVTIFDCLADRIVEGTIILFDELFNYPGWQDGEYKAFMEFTKAHGIEFEYIGYTRSWHSEQVAVKVTKR